MEGTTRGDFKNLVDETTELLEATAQLAETVFDVSKNEAPHPEADNLRRRIASLKREEFVVVVVGDIKRGKSTLLNALLRREVFVKAVTEATATVGFLRHNDAARSPDYQDRAVVHFRDGREPLVINHESLADYTVLHSEMERASKEKVSEVVEYVDVFADSRFVENGVTIVDTPGTNTIHTNHLQITYDQVDRSHAALFIFNANAPFTKTDRDFLKDMNTKIQRFFFIVNRIDQIERVSLENRERVLQHIRKEVGAIVGGDAEERIKVYGVSALKALLGRYGFVKENEIVAPDERSKLDDEDYRRQLVAESQIESLEADLERYLFQGNERTRHMLEGPLAHVRNVTTRAESHLREQMDVLSGDFDFDKLERRREDLERRRDDQQDEFERSNTTLVEKLRTTLGKTRDDLAEDLVVERRDLKDLLRQYPDYESLEADWMGETGLVVEGQRRLERLRIQASRLLHSAINMVLSAEDRRLRGRLEQELGVTLADSGPVLFRQGETIERVTRARFTELATSGVVSPETAVFDNTLATVGDLRAGRWELPARETWHSRAFF